LGCGAECRGHRITFATWGFERNESALNEIRGKGSKVAVLRGDVTDAKSLDAALSQLPKDFAAAWRCACGRCACRRHCHEMTLDQLDRAMSPKVRGAWNLHTATRDLPLDFFVLFSSVASVLGSPGQANYPRATRTWTRSPTRDGRPVCSGSRSMGPWAAAAWRLKRGATIR